MKKQKPKNKSAKLKIVNFKVTQATLDAIDKKAKELTKGNRSRLLVMAALNRKTPFMVGGKADGAR
jgi:hypothetical protein